MLSAETRFSRAVQAAHAAALAPERWPNALSIIAAYVGGSGAMMLCQDHARNEHWMMVGGLDPDLARTYLHHYADNVFARAIMRKGPGLYTAHKLADLATHRRSAFMADIWVPQRIENMVKMALPAMTIGSASGGFAVALTARNTDDLPLIMQRWKRIAPQLRLAADLYLAQSKTWQTAEAQAQLLALLPEAAFLVSAQGRILAANLDGDALLENGAGLRVGPGGTLATSDESDGQRLRAALSRAALSGRAGSIFRFVEPDRLLVVVAPAPEIDGHERLTGPGRALVRVIDMRASHQRRAATAGRLFGLSPAETLVLSHSARGTTAPAIAGRLGLSAATVRTHLSHVFDKAGVRSQAELAQLVARLPSDQSFG